MVANKTLKSPTAWTGTKTQCGFAIIALRFGPDIKGISVQFENSEINFVNPEYNEFGSNKYSLSFKTPTRSGSLDLSVTMLNEEIYTIQNMEFRNGKFNYVYKIKDKIGYTTGHW